ncbi:MAG: hypothetical protein EXX96DRAFT_641978 [Benjaminiella poitrasii]|nr:MAG: hypothetical protein EXX96DRAFT_641978 [Benjaminiella poitrasii]
MAFNYYAFSIETILYIKKWDVLHQSNIQFSDGCYLSASIESILQSKKLRVISSFKFYFNDISQYTKFVFFYRLVSFDFISVYEIVWLIHVKTEKESDSKAEFLTENYKCETNNGDFLYKNQAVSASSLYFVFFCLRNSMVFVWHIGLRNINYLRDFVKICSYKLVNIAMLYRGFIWYIMLIGRNIISGCELYRFCAGVFMLQYVDRGILINYFNKLQRYS